MATKRGFSLEEKSWVQPARNDNDSATLHVKVTGTAPMPATMTALFTREGLGTRIRKFIGAIRNEVQAGDDLFDDTILVETETPEITRRALANEGLQMVILEAVTEYGDLKFEASPGGVSVHVHSAQSTESRNPAKTGQQRTAALALHHLQAALG
jgi:hypothetical protein